MNENIRMRMYDRGSVSDCYSCKFHYSQPLLEASPHIAPPPAASPACLDACSAPSAITCRAALMMQ